MFVSQGKYFNFRDITNDLYESFSPLSSIRSAMDESEQNLPHCPRFFFANRVS